MRAYGFGVLFGVLLLGAGCTEVNNYYDCQAVDGGCMRYTEDHQGSDELEGGAGSGGGNSDWRDGASLSGSESINLGQQVALVDATVRDGIPRVISVALGFAGPNPAPPGVPAAGVADSDVVAIITLGLGANLYTAEIDFQNGVEFSVAAASVKVNADYRTVPGSPFAVNPGPVNVAATLARGAVANPQSPQRTLGQDNVIAPGATVVYNVPPFAKSFRVMQQPAGVIEVAIMGSIIIPSSLVNVVTSQSEVIEIPNGARQLYIRNAGILNCQILRVVFALSL